MTVSFVSRLPKNKKHSHKLPEHGFKVKFHMSLFEKVTRNGRSIHVGKLWLAHYILWLPEHDLPRHDYEFSFFNLNSFRTLQFRHSDNSNPVLNSSYKYRNDEKLIHFAKQWMVLYSLCIEYKHVNLFAQQNRDNYEQLTKFPDE